MFLLSIKAYFLYKAWKIVFHDLFSLSIRLGCRGFRGVTGGDRGLQGVTSGYSGLQGVREKFFSK